MSEETFRIVITIGVGIAVLCILVMAGVAVALASIGAKLKKKVDLVIERSLPIIDTAKRIAQTNEPKVSDIADRAREIAASARDIAANGKEISFQAKDIAVVAKDQAHVFAGVGRDLADRAKAQISRVDSAVDDTVDQVQHAGENVRHAVLKPVREANALLAGFKAALGKIAKGRAPHADYVTQDEEMFI